MPKIKKKLIVSELIGYIKHHMRYIVDFINKNDIIVPEVKIRYLGFEATLSFKKLEEGKPEE